MQLPHCPSTPEFPNIASRFATWVPFFLFAFLAVAGCLAGCTTGSRTSRDTDKSVAASKSSPAANRRIIAQGQLVPRAGILRILTSPGDVVEEILVQPGQPVAKGQELVRLRSKSTRSSQLDSLGKRLTDAEKQRAAAIHQARLKVDSAQVQSRQADAQVAALDRQADLLLVAQKRLMLARSTLKRLEDIAGDALTKSFVNELEIDRQRTDVETAELDYRRQEESLKQAQDAGKWSKLLAAQQLLSAQAALEAAESSGAVEILNSELASAKILSDQARVTSPIDGIVLSVDTSVGDTTTQIPLVQVADVSQINVEAEVYQSDAARVRVGQRALLRSDAFEGELTGQVQRIDRIVGRPKLRPTDPLARVDFRTVQVVISVSPEDAPRAANWLQLQVEVEIQIDGQNDSPPARPARESSPSVDRAAEQNKS